MTPNELLFPEAEHAPAEYSTGILASQQIRALVRAGFISSANHIAEEQIQPSSLDLRLGPIAHRVRASFLPTASTTMATRLKQLLIETIDLAGLGAVLDRNGIYVVPLQERLSLPSQISGKANPKSTTGRLDIFTRVITEYGYEFESVPSGYHGELFLEVVPRTFSIVAHEGDRLSQLRFVRGTPQPSDARLVQLHESDPLVYQSDGVPLSPYISNGLWVSVDLGGVEGENVVGYRAHSSPQPIDLAEIDHYDPADFWQPIPRVPNRELVLDPSEFYILASRERVGVPPGFAAEMVNYDPSVGEFRVHYAGFFDPGFGYGSGAAEGRGSRAVLEVRSHEVPFLLVDGQRVGRLLYARLMTEPDKLYGPAIGSSYQRQGLRLSKQFKDPEQAELQPASEGVAPPTV